jgi:hypothetical protein
MTKTTTRHESCFLSVLNDSRMSESDTSSACAFVFRDRVSYRNCDAVTSNCSSSSRFATALCSAHVKSTWNNGLFIP